VLSGVNTELHHASGFGGPEEALTISFTGSTSFLASPGKDSRSRTRRSVSETPVIPMASAGR
jgi:hypothetical protein